ncbi:MAG: AmmeMemoRadiSam system protein B [Magnetococcales bacterium]|nr:AmmeMemoRadiSam system protein B [Magnetococcales bacterium]MBF0437831.1 AmmeMemoRadiSam system protein B [Magnetococcales bacterium]
MMFWLSYPGVVKADSSPAMEKRVRLAAMQGGWYPDNPEKLRGYVDQQLKEAKPVPATGTVRALLVPHAGYSYSGPTAALGFKQVQGKSFKRVVVVGPSHQGGFAGLALPDTTHFATPLGEIPLDLEAIESLSAQQVARRIPGADRREHSIEMQLPWLQVALTPGWQLVPILVGRMDDAGFAKGAAGVRPLLTDDTLLVVSGDFTHYGPNFGYLPFPQDEKTTERIQQLDRGAWERIQAGDAKGLLAYKEKTGITACALGPVEILLHLFTPETMATLSGSATSGLVSKQNPNSVSYLAAAFTAPDPFAYKLT